MVQVIQEAAGGSRGQPAGQPERSPGSRSSPTVTVHPAPQEKHLYPGLSRRIELPGPRSADCTTVVFSLPHDGQWTLQSSARDRASDLDSTSLSDCLLPHDIE
ncbi:hypothetical protein ASC58_13915 [Phycicoccus sp. Root101]|nr:hypothetical protein ASC58_13915 [Phycicoccus sp. Root101]